MTKDLLQILRGPGRQSVDDSDYSPSPQPGENEGYMEEFFQEVEWLRSTIDRIQQNVEEVKAKHTHILTAPQQDRRANLQLEELMDEIQRSASQVNMRLKQMEQSIKTIEASDPSSSSLRIRKGHHQSMCQKFSRLMSGYGAMQVEYKERCKAQLRRKLELAKRSITDEELEQMLESGDPQIFTQGIMSDTQEARQNLADIEARHEDIMKLERSIRELHELFLDMATIVGAQDELVNRIDVQVEATVDHVEKAKDQMNRAVEYKKKARKTKIIIISVCVAVLVILVIALVAALVPRK